MKNKIDYIVLTWNSEKTITNTLESIQEYGKPSKIIVVDRFSKDNTSKIVNRFGCVLIRTNKPLGFARFIGAKEATTELIAYVDSDVELTRGWENVLRAALEDKFEDAGVYGAKYEGYEQTNKIKVLSGINGAFGCSITKRQLILEFKDMKKYSSAEDIAFAKFLEKKKLNWYLFPVEVKHHRRLTGIPDWLKYRWHGAGGRIEGRSFSLVLTAFLIGFLGLKRYHNFPVIKNIKFRYNYLIGYLRYVSYYEIER